MKEFVKLLETAEERNVDVSSCKWNMVQLKTKDAKNVHEVANTIRDAALLINYQLKMKVDCVQSILGASH